MRVPMLRLSAEILIVPLHADIHDDTMVDFQNDLTQQVAACDIKGVIIDVSALDVVDSFMARVLNDTASMLRLLGASVVVCGLQPAVALTLVELGRNLVDVPTAFNLENALKRLRQRMDAGQAGQAAGAGEGAANEHPSR